MLKSLSVFTVLLGILVLFGSSLTMAQNLDEVDLGAIEVVAPKDTINTITQVEIERKNATTIWQALSGVPGVTQSATDQRAEGTVSIRGSNRYEVGMYIDDIPVATAYRNEFDLNNVMVFDTETIEVSKGFSSPLLSGGFGSAGILNVRTHKPTRPLEFKAQFRNSFDSNLDSMGQFIGVMAGTKQDKFYFQVSAVQDQQDFFRLSHSFKPGRFETGGRRANSDFRNRRLNVIAGLTPTEDIDIMFGTVQQAFVRGQPIDASPNAPNIGSSGSSTRLWRWSEYKTQRYFVNANANIGPKTHVQLLSYLDKHIDMPESFQRLIGKKPAGDINHDQRYDQYAAGLKGRVDYEINPANKVSLSLGYRELSHKRDYDDGPVNMHMKEHYLDVGGEYTLKPMDQLTLIFGLSYSQLYPDIVEEGTPMVPLQAENQNIFDWQVGFFYDLPNTHQLFLTYARKSLFPTMRERFTRTTQGPPVLTGLNLKPEQADHFEIGYRGAVSNFIKFTASAFYSNTADKIVSSDIRVPNTNNSYYFVNMDKVSTWGVETGVDMTFNKFVSAGGTLSFLDWSTKTSSPNESLLTGVPKVQGSLYTVITPMEKLSITAQANLRSSFYISANPAAANNEAPGFITADLKVGYDINDYLSAEIGARNILDKNYYYGYYYPRAGRSFFVGLTGKY
ncbi:MAG: TonB-dependent receptor [Deltaproteobacteria bacterium]|jgi:iron complex outermembrane receptor protein|nr:TonB-dependent receptor [Deltaproteobacteria bacterium]